MKKIFKKFLKKQKGTAAIDQVIVTPYVLLVTFFSIMFLIFVIDYYAISNSTSLLAHRMNMGDTGYETAAASGQDDYYFNFDNWELGELATVDVAKQFSHGVIHYTATKGENNVFYKASSYYAKQIVDHGGFVMPYVTPTKLNCKVYSNGAERHGFNTKKGQTESGDIVKVEFGFKFAGFLNTTVTSYEYID